MIKNIKKILLVFVLTACMLLTSCFTSESTIGWAEFPNSIYTENFDMDVFKKDVKVTIDGNEYSLNNLPAGAQITGLHNEVGSYTLYVTYNGSSIMFAYNVISKGSLVGDFDISWYNNYQSEFEICNGSDEDNVNQLKGLAYLVNIKHYSFSGKVIKLMNDVDLTNVAWTPIGEGSRKSNYESGFADFTGKDGTGYFAGTFNGNDHSITGLSNNGYFPKGAFDYETSSGSYIEDGYTFGLFGRVVGATICNLVFKNVNINCCVENIISGGQNITITGDSVAALVGYVANSSNNCLISNIIVESGSIASGECAAGIVGKSYGNTRFVSCKNGADITSVAFSGSRASGICAYVGAGISPIFEECENTGTIKAKKWPSAITSCPEGIMAINCKNSGEVFLVGTDNSETFSSCMFGRSSYKYLENIININGTIYGFEKDVNTTYTTDELLIERGATIRKEGNGTQLVGSFGKK